MSVTYTFRRIGPQTVVTATSSLTPPVYYHWYLDGVYQGRTETPTKAFTLERNTQADIVCVDTTSTSFDPVASAPETYPARRTLFWVRSQDTDVSHYLVQQSKSGGTYTTFAKVPHNGAWTYQYITPRLDDLTEYTWRIVPVDLLGNEGAAYTIGPEYIVRTPDAPVVTATYEDGSITVSEE